MPDTRPATSGGLGGAIFPDFGSKRGGNEGSEREPPHPPEGGGGAEQERGAGKRENHRRAILGRSHFSANTSGLWLFQRPPPGKTPSICAMALRFA